MAAGVSFPSLWKPEKNTLAVQSQFQHVGRTKRSKVPIFCPKLGGGLGHLLPTFCSKMPLFPQFYSKNGSKICPYMGQIFLHSFGSSVSVFSINFWRILECEPKKTSFGGNIKCILGKICFWLGKC